MKPTIEYITGDDIAYVRFSDETGPGVVKRSLGFGDVLPEGFILDFDGEGRLLGIEILAASKILSPGMLRLARRE